MPLDDLNVDYDQLAEICQRYHVVKLELFGSRAKGDARPDSDVDLLVTFAEGQEPGLEFVTFAEELELCLGLTVDVLTRASIERSDNPVRRRSILSSAESIYAAA